MSVASNSRDEAERLTCIHHNASAVLIDTSDQQTVERLVEEADVVVRSVKLYF